MRLFKGMGLAALGTIGFVGCADEQPVQTTPQGLKVAVAPLTLAGIDEACYDIKVTNDVNGGGQTVWSQGDPLVTALGADQTIAPGAARTLTVGDSANDTGSICSTQYGNSTGGDITYIGPCDADALEAGATAGTNGGRMNSVTIWVDGIYENGADMEQYQDPCGTAGCQLEFECIENQDTLVEFNFTIMRDANQGFFDVAVNFEDIFCSAKVDCRYDTDNDGAALDLTDEVIRLVHTTDANDAQRTATAVLGFACTDGDAFDDSRVYLSQVQVHCDAEATPDGEFDAGEAQVLIPVAQDGNVYTAATVPAGGLVAQAMVFQGQEELLNGTASADKLYWNVAVGLVEQAGGDIDTAVIGDGNCWLTAYGTASKGDLAPVLAGQNVSYPYIVAKVKLSDENANLICDQFPLNEWTEAVYADAPTNTVLAAPANGVGTEYGSRADFQTIDTNLGIFEMVQGTGTAVTVGAGGWTP